MLLEKENCAQTKQMHKFILLYFSSDMKINIHINIISHNIHKTADAVYEFFRDKMRLSKVFKNF